MRWSCRTLSDRVWLVDYFHFPTPLIHPFIQQSLISSSIIPIDAAEAFDMNYDMQPWGRDEGFMEVLDLLNRFRTDHGRECSRPLLIWRTIKGARQPRGVRVQANKLHDGILEHPSTQPIATGGGNAAKESLTDLIENTELTDGWRVDDFSPSRGSVGDPLEIRVTINAGPLYEGHLKVVTKNLILLVLQG
jgi:hypothetical protein